jgi:type IV secretion system protein VirB9
MTGKTQLAPVNVWDNKQFTFFKFPGAVDVPTIFMVNPDGTESIVNHHIEGAASDTVVVHKVAAQWVLRLGPAALSVFNESYDPVGESNTSRTASPEVIRDVIGGTEQ